MSKSFGRTKALDGLDLTVAPGDITGFLGPNGAGKSTTIRVLLGLLRADGGTVRLLGGDPWRDAVALHRRIAYVPGDVTLWPNLTGLQAIDFLARLRGNGVDTRRRDQLIERFELDPHKKARTYSKGNRQKVAIVAAFSTNAELYILDEPTSGLDPLMEKAFQHASRRWPAAARRCCCPATSWPRSKSSATTSRSSAPAARCGPGSLDELRHLMRTTVTVRTRADGQALQRNPSVHDFAIDDGHYTFSVDRNELDRDGPTHRSRDPRPDRDTGIARGHVPARVPGSDPMTTTAIAPRTERHEAAQPGRRGRAAEPAAAGVAPRPCPPVGMDAVLTLMMVYAPNAIKLAYPEEAQRQARVNLMKTPAAIIMGGPMFGGNETDLGAMMANELMLTMIVATSILAILTVIRHTRAEEESGAAELVLSSVVGRYARTYAALILVGGVNAVLAVTMTLAMASTGFAIVDTAAMCLGITGVAMVFGAVAAVTAQLWRQSRTATGAAMAALALAALVRGIGDVINNSGSALSWFSPIAWAQQMRAFVDLRWWPFALLVVLAIALMALAAALESRRQYDDGNIPSTGERPNAHAIKTVFGLHLTLQRGQTIGWAVGLFLGGLAFGSMTKSLLDAAKDNELLQRVLVAQGTDGVYTTMTQFLAAAATAYVVGAVLRVLSDEEKGLGEAVLAGAVSRWRWLFTAVRPRWSVRPC